MYIRMSELSCLDCSNIEVFSLDGLVMEAKVVKVYDGDSITVVFKYMDTYHKWLCRLNGIDSPEIKSSNPEEKQMAIKARDFLREKIFDKIIEISCGKFDKYGRLLCTVFIDDININDLMVEECHAVRYDGGTKKRWT